MNLVNLLRDQTFCSPGTAQVSPGATTTAISTNTVTINSDGVVNQTNGFVWGADQRLTATSFTTWYGVGLMMQYPIVDATPYRLKGYVSARDCIASFFLGYAPSSPTGTGDLITKIIASPLTSFDMQEHGKIDDIVTIPSLPESDPDYGKPIAFGFAFVNPTSNAILHYSLQVQNMANTSPQFAASMS